jgi:hypothetical protein
MQVCQARHKPTQLTPRLLIRPLNAQLLCVGMRACFTEGGKAGTAAAHGTAAVGAADFASVDRKAARLQCS